MKKIIALLCLLAMVLPLCACGGGSLTLEETATEVKTEEKKTETAEEEKGEIVYPEGFSVGFGRADISGPLPVETYESEATVVGDPLMLTVVAVCDGESVALLINADALGIKKKAYDSCAKLIAKYNIPAENLLINATHSHSAPSIGSDARWMKRHFQVKVRPKASPSSAAISSPTEPIRPTVTRPPYLTKPRLTAAFAPSASSVKARRTF